jgi:hypothetical protein
METRYSSYGASPSSRCSSQLMLATGIIGTAEHDRRRLGCWQHALVGCFLSRRRRDEAESDRVPGCKSSLFFYYSILIVCAQPEWAGLRVDPGMTTRAMEEYLFLFWTRIHVTQAPAIHRASFKCVYRSLSLELALTTGAALKRRQLPSSSR